MDKAGSGRQDRSPTRSSVRLNGYDYRQAGAYFVTVCTEGRLLFFEDAVALAAAERCWLEIPDHFSVVELDEWVVMPNHVHGIVVLTEDKRRGVRLNARGRGHRNDDIRKRPRIFGNKQSEISPQRDTLSVVIRTYKAAVTTQCRQSGLTSFGWQRNYYERVIRDESELNRVRQYIMDNPARWDSDEYNPKPRIAP